MIPSKKLRIKRGDLSSIIIDDKKINLTLSQVLNYMFWRDKNQFK